MLCVFHYNGALRDLGTDGTFPGVGPLKPAYGLSGRVGLVGVKFRRTEPEIFPPTHTALCQPPAQREAVTYTGNRRCFDEPAK